METLSYSDKADLLHMYYAQILIYILTVSMSMAEVAFKLTYALMLLYDVGSHFEWQETKLFFFDSMANIMMDLHRDQCELSRYANYLTANIYICLHFGNHNRMCRVFCQSYKQNMVVHEYTVQQYQLNNVKCIRSIRPGYRVRLHRV